MKKTFCCAVLIFICCTCYSQKNKPDSCLSCIEVVKELSYYWKLDSLASNGFRRYTFHKFLNCKLTPIYPDVLLNKLGKPNEIRKTNQGVEYLYYYFDIKKMPKNYNAPAACWYINFKFENDQNILSAIEEGDIDR